MEKNKIKIYLCDLVHNYVGAGTYMFPLNIGFIAAWVKKYFPEKVDIELFKYPSDFIKRFKEEKPDLVGFANYTWNADLNNRLSAWVKSLAPETIIVFGGPNINYSQKGYQKFFNDHKGADFYVIYQGEVAFANILTRIFEKGKEISDLKEEAIDGVVFSDKNGNIISGKLIPRLKQIDEIPSPYLTGLLDKFFEENLIPIVETNRGCPYQCTYCCQGMSSYNQIEFYSLERVKKELKYIAERVKNTNILIFADSNFGILERDVEIARYIAELMKETGYPRRVNMNWAKNQPKIFEIAKILKNINLIISQQSLDEVVLKNIKRQNIQTSFFKDIINKVNQEGGTSGTEIILALPGETKESHLNSLRKLFDWNVSYIICYNCLLLEGSEMSLTRESGEFQCKTKFRLIDVAFGDYDGIKSFEFEEGVRELPTMSEEDILYFRPVHCLIQFLWNYRFYYDLLKYLQFLGVNPLDYMVKLIENIGKEDTPEKIKNIFQTFKKEAKEEWFDSPEAFREHYIKPENFEWLKKGNYGKLNGKYIFKILLGAKEEFESYLYNTAINLSPVCNSKKEIIGQIIKFLSLNIIDFNKDWEDISQEKKNLFIYNILEWRDSNYQKELEQFNYPQGINISFYLPEEQKKSLQILFKQYEHENKNVTLRKMSEFMLIKDFFYRVKSV